MAFRGEASQIPLSNIFQTLGLSGQEGVLEIVWKGGARRLRFTKGGVRVVPDRPGSVEPLRTALIKQRVLSEAQFTNVQKTLSPEVALLDALYDRRVITAEHMAESLPDHFCELVLAVFRESEAHFNFTVETAGAVDDFVTRPELARSLTFEITALLMEAARREDEWARIAHLVPGGREIFAPREPRALAHYIAEHVTCRELGADFLQLLDGEHSLNQIVANSRFFPFQVFSTIAGLIEAGLLEPLDVDRKRELAKKHRRNFRFDEAADVCRSLLELNPRDHEARKNLAGILDRQGKVEELIVHWRELALNAAMRDDPGEAKEYLEKILGKQPEDLASLLALSRLQQRHGRIRDAMRSAQRLIAAARAHPDPPAALGVVKDLVAEFPGELPFRHELARMYHRAGDAASALALLRGLAEHYAGIRSFQNLRKACEQIVTIDPQGARAFDALLEQERRAAQRRVGFLKRLSVKGAIALAGIAAIAFVAFEARARRAYAAVRGDVNQLLEDRRFEEAHAVAAAAAAGHRRSLVYDRFSELLQEIESAKSLDASDRRQVEARRAFDVESLLQRARVLEQRGQHGEAARLVNGISRDGLEGKLAEQLASVTAGLNAYLGAAQSLARNAREAEAAARWRDACLYWQQLRRQFPGAPESRTVRYPLQIQATPPGAEVWLDGALAGTSPTVVRWPASGRAQLVVRKQSYAPFSRELSDGEVGWSLPVALAKLSAWRYECGAAVESATVTHGDRTFIADRGGRLHAVELRGGGSLWQLDLGEIGGVSAALRGWSGRIICVTIEGSFLQISRDGRLLTRATLPVSAPIKLSPSVPTEDGVLAVAGDGGDFCMMRLDPCGALWQGRMPARIMTAPVAVPGRRVLIGDVSGNLWRCSLAAAEISARRRFNHPLSVPPLPYGEEGAIVSAGPEVHVFADLAKGEILARETFAAPVTAMHGGEDGLYVATDDGFLAALKPPAFAVAWRLKLPRPAQSVLAGSNAVYAACEAEVLAFTGQGRPAWNFPCKGRVWAIENPDADHLLAGGEDRGVVLFDLAPDA